ncbi:hypothetical protein JN11_04853 [Mucilaginibacter frigoritolerans]|uniref:Uncharacterized protein n=1 Tax=Mucilaginibacter frigoritolerans TaxID=652788 RepID=A0A562TLS6_9SPHI|nr:hypothetical protein [Mucilaginibacter frigoritolerans]TWI94036.1 hypothetical protein JN11_04853 [Mucilaginibacter frigoritolerans]
MKIYCPTCDHGYLTIKSRKKYFTKAGVCFVILLLFYFLFDEWGFEDIKIWDASFGPLMLTCIWGSLLVSALSIVGCVYYITKGILQKEATYKCGYCKSESRATSLSEEHDAMHALLTTLTKSEAV